MAKKYVYQTLENRGNPDEIEGHGPYVCRWENSWLGDGYYFWDTFIDNAHWWGINGRAYKKGYIICKAECDFNDVECCDLVGNTEHISWFHGCFELMLKKGIANETTTVRRLIEYLKNVLKTFSFDAIRVHGIRSKDVNSEYHFQMSFEDVRRPQYLDLMPAIQICFYRKTSLNLRNYLIVFPYDYVNDYVV